MTDRTISLLVTLDNEYRVDNAEFIMNAIKMIKGVLDVRFIATQLSTELEKTSLKLQIHSQLRKKLHELLES